MMNDEEKQAYQEKITRKWRGFVESIRCPRCYAPPASMRLRFNSETGYPFAGCERYPDCTHTMKMDDIRQEWSARHVIDIEVTLDDDVTRSIRETIRRVTA